MVLDSKGRPRRPPRLQYINSINQRHISGSVGTVGSFSAGSIVATGSGGLSSGGGGFGGGGAPGGAGGGGGGAGGAAGGGGGGGRSTSGGGDLEAGVGGSDGSALGAVTAESLAAAIARKRHTDMETARARLVRYPAPVYHTPLRTWV